MRLEDFHYELPERLIAKQPTKERRGSRLLSLDGESGAIEHLVFSDIKKLVAPGDLMVFNDTRVIPARIFGQKASGGRVEILVERVLQTDSVLAHVRASKSPRLGSSIILADGTTVEVMQRQESLYVIKFPEDVSALDVLQRIGQVPLPPYIDREAAEGDRERYQTVYGSREGAVAAPTAGLHFDQDLLRELEELGVNLAFVTLHVGAGTFQPVRVDDIRQHKMHSEVMELSDAVCQQVKATRAAGKRVIAVGTTSVRCLETAAQSGEIRAYQGETNIFIYPSYRYRVVDALITNFHLPESTLLMLVSAFAGYDNIMKAYNEAIKQRYRFFSYGDAMFITHNDSVQDGLPT